MAKVWLVAGSARGLGRAVAEAALAAGEHVVATARNPRGLADLVERYGDRVRAVALDVTDADAAIRTMQTTLDAFGRLDVVVNNAGYGHLAPFGVQVTALEPGGMKTDWGATAGSATPALLSDYVPSVGKLIEWLAHYFGNETSDPAKVAQVILRLAYHGNLPPHLLLGSDALYFSREGDKARAAAAALWHDVSVSTDYAAAGPVPALPTV